MSVLPFISSAPEGFELRKLDLTGESRNAYSVSNMAAAFDGNYNTFANAAFWGAGQGIKVDLGGSKRIGMARLVSDVYAGPEWGFCIMRFGGASIKTLLADRKKEVTWEGDVMASELDITEYARTRVYTIEVWEKVPLPSTPPKVIMPVVLSPLEVATNSAVESINGGPEKADVLRNAINATASEEALQLVQAEIDYWQDWHAWLFRSIGARLLVGGRQSARHQRSSRGYTQPAFDMV